MFDLTNFTLRDMTELGSVLRRAGADAASMQGVAERIVRCLYETLVDPASNEPECTLVRFFKTHPYGALDDETRAFARRLLNGEGPASAEMQCLTLLATAGDRPEWNDRSASVSHRAIPLVSREIVARAPMISSLLQQLGIGVEDWIKRRPVLLGTSDVPSFNVFYVPEASTSPNIPDQENFVRPAKIASVLGFGGMLPAGDIFAVILFSKVPIPRETAELFRTLALNVKVAVLPFDEAVLGQD